MSKDDLTAAITRLTVAVDGLTAAVETNTATLADHAAALDSIADDTTPTAHRTPQPPRRLDRREPTNRSIR